MIYQRPFEPIDRIHTNKSRKWQKEEEWRPVPQVDTGELIDVAVAQRAGLGFIGRNGLLITRRVRFICSS